MSTVLRRHWIIWSVLTLLVAAGSIAFFLSTESTAVEFRLEPGATADLSVFRLRHSSFSATLAFARDIPGLRPELGSFTHRGDAKSSGMLDFPNPGAPIKLQISRRDNGMDNIYEALPAGSYGPTIGRELIPFTDDHDPQQFIWPPSKASLSLPFGWTDLHITVLEVGKPLLGEHVALWLQPPVTLKSVEPAYSVLILFFVWPAYVAILAVYGAILLWQTWRARRRP